MHKIRHIQHAVVLGDLAELLAQHGAHITDRGSVDTAELTLVQGDREAPIEGESSPFSVQYAWAEDIIEEINALLTANNVHLGVIQYCEDFDIGLYSIGEGVAYGDGNYTIVDLSCL